MIRLLTYHYHDGKNYVVGKCDTCFQIVTGELSDEIKLKCRCDSTVITKVPIHYLIHSKPTMIIFSLIHKTTNKELIAVTLEGSTKDITKPIDREIENIAKNNLYPELSKELRDEGIGNFKITPLAFPNSLSQAMLQEKLYINSRKTMQPKGYNSIYVIEKVLKG